MQYLTIGGEFCTKYEILHSVFICHIKGISSFEEGMEYVSEISKKYSDATHNCYAIITKNGQQKMSDDGEPSGTAGIPIGQVIKNKNLVNVVAVITRYFGGIKLGAGGLVSAYTQSIANAINISEITTMIESKIAKTTLDYASYSAFLNFLNSIKSKIIDTQYDNEVTIEFAFPVDIENIIYSQLGEISAGKANLIIEKENKYFSY